MKKTISIIAMAMLCLFFKAKAQLPIGQPTLYKVSISGKITSPEGEALAGATIFIKKTAKTISTDRKGQFNLTDLPLNSTLIVSFIGYLAQEVVVKENRQSFVIILHPDSKILETVTVNTGYQTLSKAKTTGSFVQLNNEILNRRVSTGILDRLEDLVPGLSFSKNNSGLNFLSSQSQLSIRGQSTILGNANPLIVIDNFPYDGDLNTLNPNDVESITVLKDAAAASIWGAKAGNGVIVITTKKGKLNQPVQLSFNTNLTIGNKPDLFYQPQMSSAEFIEMEKKLFAKGFYRNAELSTANAPLTPAVDLLIAKRDGLISGAQADAAIEQLKNIDTRNELRKYFMRNSINQQYALSLSGGNEIQRYYIAIGYDKNLSAIKPGAYDRFTLNMNSSHNFLNKKLQLNVGMNVSQSNTTPAWSLYNPGFSGVTKLPYYPYAKLVAENGDALPVVSNYRAAYAESAVAKGLLDWRLRPLDELNLADNHIKLNDYRLNTGLNYKILPGLTAQVLYLFNLTLNDNQNRQSINSYYTRNLVNSFTQTNAGILSYPIPRNDIIDWTRNRVSNQNLRGQLQYEKVFSEKHSLTFLTGYEIKDLHNITNLNRAYGYDSKHAILSAVQYNIPYKQFANNSSLQIPFLDNESDLTDRYRSYFINGSYTYNDRLTISASGRRDESNLFGVKANEKGVPLYAVGLGWDLYKESFYKAGWLPYLKLRGSYGYNGNVYKNISAYTTASFNNYYSSSPNTGLPYAQILNPPNPELRWERVRMINMGIDFSSRNNKISGSVDFYTKKGYDLIGVTPYDPTTGVNVFTGNYAGTSGKGLDLILNTNNIDAGIKWNTSFLFSYSSNKVNKYNVTLPGSYYVDDYGRPLEGKPLLSIYSYKSAGLDPLNGDPRGYLNNQISKDYENIINEASTDNIVFNGSAIPVYFGSLRNTLTWKHISLSVNMVYRLGYYFKKQTVNFQSVLNGKGGHGDYALRWQNPGDEVNTIIPSLPIANDVYRNQLARNSETLVARADHLRLQDINLTYNITKNQLNSLPFDRLQVYLYANNLGVIWRANKFGIDPDYQVSGPPPITLSIGFKADF